MNVFLAHLLLLMSLIVNAYAKRMERAHAPPKIMRRYPSTFTTSYNAAPSGLIGKRKKD